MDASFEGLEWKLLQRNTPRKENLIYEYTFLDAASAARKAADKGVRVETQWEGGKTLEEGRWGGIDKAQKK